VRIPAQPEGADLVLDYADNGPGMDAETRAGIYPALFHPLFDNNWPMIGQWSNWGQMRISFWGDPVLA